MEYVKCKFCKNEIPSGSIFCNWCGERLIKERKKPQEISVPKPRKLPSGRWTIQLRAEGESVTEDTADACIARAKAVRAGWIAKQPKSKADITLSQAIDKYIETTTLKDSTIEGYEKIKRIHFPSIMEKRLSDLTQNECEKALQLESKRISRRGKPYAAKTIHNAWFLVESVLKVYAPHLKSTNAKLPEKRQSIPLIIEPEKLIPAIRGTDIELPCLLAIWLSLSMSEVRGLTKSKSLVNGKLMIAETVVRVKRKDIRKDGGKEENRYRMLAVPSYIQSLIDQVDGDIIVPMTGSQIYKRFQKLLAENGLPSISFHRLRHINASVMSLLDVDSQSANDRGGWKTDYVRKRVYTHTFSKARQQADATIDEYFEKIINQNAQVTNAFTNAPEK